MYLRALRLKGFKSFPKQTELLFEPGVAVVIGPNGSGKSNLSEAVMWALGEQSPTSVRGSSMQDMIFAGSDGRRASGSAEVELTFDNSDGTLPLPTPEVSIGRRVGRDGESKYFINRSSCRLTDVVELMAGFGLGKEMHSIVGQGKVESFLLSKPADRRALIEEAAGLGRYKRRRERAELKLSDVRRNLERVELMEKELAAQLTPLRRQANAAEQLRAVERELAETRGRLLAGELEECQGRQGEEEARLRGIDERRAAVEGELADLAGARRREEEAFARRLEERERRAKRMLRARVLAGRLDSCERLTGQRLGLIGELERAARGEQERLVGELAGRPEEPAGDAWPAEEAGLAEAVVAAESSHEQAATTLEAARRELGETRAAHERAAGEHELALSRGARLHERADVLATELTRQERELVALRQDAATNEADLSKARAEVDESEAALAAAVAAAAAAAAEAAAAEQEAIAADQRLQAATRERRVLEAEIEHAQATLQEVLDVDGDVMAVAADFPGAIAFSSALACAPGYERALAAALAQVSGALAVPEEIDHWSLLAALKRAGVGLARLVLARPAGGTSTAFPGAVPLLDKVTIDGPRSLEDALARVVIVDDLRAVPAEYGGIAVTRDGEFYRPGEGELGLAAGVPAALLLERRAALNEAQSKLDAVRAHELREEALAARAVAARAASAAEANRCRAGETVAQAADAQAGRALTAAERREHDCRELLDRGRRRDDAMEAERDEALAEAAQLEAVAAAAARELESLAPALAAAESAVETARSVHDGALASVTRARVQLDERRAVAQRAERDRAEALARAQGARQRLGQLERRLSSLPGVRNGCEDLAAALAAVHSRANQVLARLEEVVEETATPARAALQDFADREARVRHVAEALAEERAHVQVALARMGDRHGELAGQLDEIGARLERAAFEPPESEAEGQALREHVERLLRRRERIGPVNPLAEAECEELGGRASFVRDQRRDLEQSTAELLELIKDLTERIDADFAVTFAAVQEQFEQMIGILFPGGRGRLVLVEGDQADEPGGVAVEVKPARKLGKELQQLSGGERSLVAIGFLMALVLSRPCPFYILDEIEAALDDVNIGRFVSLVREYRHRTQFVIITHQKRTMEAADVLYGVTMGPDGASRVVSARMAEEEIERQAAGAGTGASGT